ncbi:MAG: hypothetical protein J07HQW2_01275 [Haloquadratum walsbyi J07HQW2]|jgi:hypothetical protein|uniref:DUF8142 domain-containing protein n=1 Tax=Haloquadratum walsbyi J07HQW2 TaxID=1238425 RepID=U1NDL5_9EURY|nr:hypothetical protein [Haloquadratum walsbyi]ERG94833.1 MAG: hypothetical protein J07HQW2_01275 [Haloquadratum walsbyi J07HQW2]
MNSRSSPEENTSTNADRSIKVDTTAGREVTTQKQMTKSEIDANGTSSFDPDAPLGSDSGGHNRRRAAIAVAPFLAIGLGNLVLLLGWGIEPLWAFAILPPILFCSVLAYIVFSTDFLSDRT